MRFENLSETSDWEHEPSQQPPEEVCQTQRRTSSVATDAISPNQVSWRRTLSIGLLLYVVGLVIFGLTDNITLFPSLMLLGSFLVPVTYVAFFYQHRHLSTASLPTVALTFFYGGFLGAFAATLLEAIYAFELANVALEQILLVVSPFVGAGLIEEAAKLLGVLVVARRARHDAEIDGIILGAAAGMGFAALESSGYVFAAYVGSHGSLSVALAVTVLRGVLAPLGHGTWTAIIVSVLFRETRQGRFRFDLPVVGAYVIASLLHAVSDSSPAIIASLNLPGPIALVATLLVLVLVGAIGLFVLWLRWREALQRQLTSSRDEGVTRHGAGSDGNEL